MGQKLLAKAKILSSKNGSHFGKEVTKVDLVSEKSMEVYSYTLNLSVLEMIIITEQTLKTSYERPHNLVDLYDISKNISDTCTMAAAEA